MDVGDHHKENKSLYQWKYVILKVMPSLHFLFTIFMTLYYICIYVYIYLLLEKVFITIQLPCFAFMTFSPYVLLLKKFQS